MALAAHVPGDAKFLSHKTPVDWFVHNWQARAPVRSLYMEIVLLLELMLTLMPLLMVNSVQIAQNPY